MKTQKRGDEEINPPISRVDLEFQKVAKEFIGQISKDRIVNAYKVFVRGRTWDKLHPVYDKRVEIEKTQERGFLGIFKSVKYNPKPSQKHYKVINTPLGYNRVDYTTFFRKYAKITKNKNYTHLTMAL